MKIIFLDIDGVLMTGRAWAMPANAGIRSDGHEAVTIVEAAQAVTFDADAVALLNRLCDETGAKLVILSNWRHTIGPDATRAKLIEQGVDPKHFHEDFFTPTHRSLREPEKWFDLIDWLEDHCVERTASGWIVIDDEPVSETNGFPQVMTPFHTGFDLAAFEHARALLTSSAS